MTDLGVMLNPTFRSIKCLEVAQRRLSKLVVFTEITDMLPGILNQLGTESLSNLKKLATSVTGGGDHKANPAEIDDDDDDVPGTR